MSDLYAFADVFEPAGAGALVSPGCGDYPDLAEGEFKAAVESWHDYLFGLISAISLATEDVPASDHSGYSEIYDDIPDKLRALMLADGLDAWGKRQNMAKWLVERLGKAL